MPFHFFISKKETETNIEDKYKNESESKIKTSTILENNQTTDDIFEENEWICETIFEDTIIFDENYYKTKMYTMLKKSSCLFHTYKKIVKEEIKNEIHRFTISPYSNYNNIYIENGI